MRGWLLIHNDYQETQNLCTVYWILSAFSNDVQYLISTYHSSLIGRDRLNLIWQPKGGGRYLLIKHHK